MKRYATDRLTLSATLSLIGALIAVLVGMPEVALFVAPWLVLCAFGMTSQHAVAVQAHVAAAQARMLIGDVNEVQVTMTATSQVRVDVTPQRHDAFENQGPARVVDVAAPGAPAQINFQVAANEWGTHDVGQADIEVTMPYGLFKMRTSAERSQLVRVHPTPQQLAELLRPWMVRRTAGTHRSRESAQGVEYADLRKFASGDSVRDINWRASARSAELWVSLRHPDRATDVVMLVDSFVESGHDVRTIFGLVVESAVALAEGHLGATDRVGLIEFGGLVRWVSPGTGRVQLQRLTDALLATRLHANAADKQLPILPTRALPPRSFVVAFTPLLDQRFIDALFTARARGHDVAVIECAPFGQEDAADRPSERSALRMWHAERAMARDRMAEQAIAVVRWDGTEPIDVALRELSRRRRRVARIGGR